MNIAAKLGIYALSLAVAFGLALGVGNAVGPIGSDDEDGAAAGNAPAAESSGTEGHGHEADAGEGDGEASGEAAEDDGAAAAAEELPGGLMVSTDGYTFALAESALPAGPATPLSFQIIGPDGEPVTAYEETHDEELHLIAVRRDMSGFQHVHPTRDAAGTWSIPLALTPGQWRLFADFAVPGLDEGLTLGADLAVAGGYDPLPLPAPSPTYEVDGYTVTLDGELRPGEGTMLTLSISKDGQPVTDLEPYLAAYGHLVALRSGDLAYLHVHPDGEPGDGVTPSGPDVAFHVTAPSAGAYRLFLDFKHDGVVRTAEFTVNAGDLAGPGSAAAGATAEPGSAAEPGGAGTGSHSHGGAPSHGHNGDAP